MAAIIWVFITAALAAASSVSADDVSCKVKPLEVVFAVDLSSSLMPEGYKNLKLFLQSMADHLPIGASQTRPAVIGFSTEVKVEVNLGDANDAQSFKDAIEKIPFYRGLTATGVAMQVARLNVFPNSRPGASKLLIVVTDGVANIPDSISTARDLVRSESAKLLRQGVRIHAVGVGDNLLRQELVAIAGSNDISMINDFKGLKTLVDDLAGEICNVRCKSPGAESFPGQCFNGTQRIVHVTTEHNELLNRCEKAITQEFKYCGKSHLCKDVEVTVGDCVKGLREVVTTWEDFDVLEQNCVQRRSVQPINCTQTEDCKEPAAEIMYLLDSSGSINAANWARQIEFVYRLVSSMKVAPGAIHVGVVLFGTSVTNKIPLGSVKSKSALLREIERIQQMPIPQWTNIGDAIRLARNHFAMHSRPGVAKVVILMTDGDGNVGANPIDEAAKLESDGIVINVIGIGKDIKKKELEAIATPPLADHLFYAENFVKLLQWAGKISQQTCESITPPDPSLCDLPPKRVVSSCYNSLQKITEVKYEYDAQGKCAKRMLSHTTSPCKVICTDPINGNQYYDGETWRTECATFHCRRPDSQFSVFRPTAQECPGSENKCHSIHSHHNFECYDDRGQLFGRCNCLSKNGNPLLLVITAEANPKP